MRVFLLAALASFICMMNFSAHAKGEFIEACVSQEDVCAKANLAPLPPEKQAELRAALPTKLPYLVGPRRSFQEQSAPLSSELAQTMGETLDPSIDDRIRASLYQTLFYPYNTIAYLEIKYPSGNIYRCTATLVSPTRAITASHCLYNSQEGGAAVSVTLYPGLFEDGNGNLVAPFGSIVAQTWNINDAFKAIEPAERSGTITYGDVAVDMASLTFAPVTYTSKFMPLLFGAPADADVVNCGYPASVLQQATHNLYCDPSRSVIAQLTGTWGFDLLASGGDSGSPIIKKSPDGSFKIIGILDVASGDNGVRGTYGAYFDESNQGLLSGWVGGSGTKFTFAPTTGWWWNPNAAGVGYSIEFSPTDDNVFLAAYMYDTAGNPAWYVGTLTRSDDITFKGDLTYYSGGESLSGTYRAPTQSSSVATVKLTLASSPASATLSISGNGITPLATPIQRYAIVSGGLASLSLSPQPETGWWWDRSEPGSGYFLEIQSGTLFLGAYAYDGTGKPVWYTALNTTTKYTAQNGITNTAFSGTFVQNGHGQTLGGAYQPASLVNANVGGVSIQWTSPTTATLVLPNGTQKTIERFKF